MSGPEVAALLTRGDLTSRRCEKTLRLLNSRKDYDAMLDALPPRWRECAADACEATATRMFGGRA